MTGHSGKGPGLFKTLDLFIFSMDAIYLRMPKPMRKVMDVIIALIGVGQCGYVTKIGYDSMRQGIEYGELLPSSPGRALRRNFGRAEIVPAAGYRWSVMLESRRQYAAG